MEIYVLIRSVQNVLVHVKIQAVRLYVPNPPQSVKMCVKFPNVNGIAKNLKIVLNLNVD